MTRLLTCGYETGDINELGVSTVSTNTTLTVVSSSPTPRGATYCLKAAATAGTTPGTYKTFSFGTSKTELWMRFAVYIHPVGGPEYTLAILFDSGGNPQINIGWGAGPLRLRLAGTSAGTLLGESTPTIPADTWHVIEWRMQITDASNGSTEVWLDGAQVITFTGNNTQTAVANVQSLRLGLMTASAVSSGTYLAFDDFAVNDTSGSSNSGQIYDGRVVLLTPTGAGSTTAQTRGGTDSGANWSQVDELPPSMTDYVYSATAGTRDLYVLQDVPAGSWSINCLDVLAYAQNSDALAGSLGLTVKSGTTTNEGTAQSLTSTAGYIRQLYETDPNTSTAWTVAAVNALEAGTTVR